MSIDRLIDSVWGEDAPTRAVVNVQVYVSKLRTLLQVDNSHQIVRRVPGHLLAASWLDLQQFRQLAARAAEGIRSHAGARRSRQRQRRWRRLGDICAALNWGNPVDGRAMVSCGGLGDFLSPVRPTQPRYAGSTR